jgi:hypothetical protein
MITTAKILQASHLAFQPHKFGAGVFLTMGGQLVAPFRRLKDFQHLNRDYFQWQAHHIVETVDLDRLGVTLKFPPREGQICVLLPERAHIGRVNSVLRHENPLRLSASAGELRVAYRQAYSLIGDYCGGGELVIRRELMAIVDTIFALAGLRAP